MPRRHTAPQQPAPLTNRPHTPPQEAPLSALKATLPPPAPPPSWEESEALASQVDSWPAGIRKERKRHTPKQAAPAESAPPPSPRHGACAGVVVVVGVRVRVGSWSAIEPTSSRARPPLPSRQLLGTRNAGQQFEQILTHYASNDMNYINTLNTFN